MHTEPRCFISPKKANAAGRDAVKGKHGNLNFRVEPHIQFERDGSAAHCFRVSLWSPRGSRVGWIN